MSIAHLTWDDTIVALATPPGLSALAVIRLSGANAVAIINRLFPSKDLSAQPANTLHVGFLVDGTEVLDEVVLSLFKGPRSYTGEDVVEVSCHGSPYVAERLMTAFITHGARLARPGEFTQRAFLKGKMDLTQAEAVADLIASHSAAAHQSAIRNIRGGFSEVLKDLREQLIRFSALIELELDFSQEDVEFADRGELEGLVSRISVTVDGLVESFRLGNVIKGGVGIAIVGRPNAGKSTLLNTLLNENRAIVSETAGTTRDTIEEVLNIDGILFRLIDTAGIRESQDAIEAIGVERSLEKMRTADLVLYLFDVSTETPEELESALHRLEGLNPSYLLVGNKSDILSEEELSQKFAGIDALYLSARTGLHVNLLKRRLVDKVLQGAVVTEGVMVTNARHYESLRQVSDSLLDIRRGLQDRIPGDLLALDIRRCLHYLGEITGEVTNEDQLDFIFSKFCIGK